MCAGLIKFLGLGSKKGTCSMNYEMNSSTYTKNCPQSYEVLCSSQYSHTVRFVTKQDSGRPSNFCTVELLQPATSDRQLFEFALPWEWSAESGGREIRGRGGEGGAECELESRNRNIEACSPCSLASSQFPLLVHHTRVRSEFSKPPFPNLAIIRRIGR